MEGIQSGAMGLRKRHPESWPHRARGVAWLALFGFLLALSIAIFYAQPGQSRPSEALLTHPDFVGAEVCACCHASAYSAWSTSHHHPAMLPATPENVVADFNDVEVSFGGVRTRFIRRGNNFFVHTEGADSRMAEFPVRYTFGIAPLQPFLLPRDRGRLQAFPIAWHSRPVCFCRTACRQRKARISRMRSDSGWSALVRQMPRLSVCAQPPMGHP